MQYYDLIIVGTGPAGLALAHICSNIYRRVLIIDKEYSIGGIHRVKRDFYGIYTEYGPRIYMSVFYNFINIIREIGLDYNTLFKRYKYNYI
jgi:phytoene dehydrogenase-like protein